MNRFELLIFSSEDCTPCKKYIPTVKQVCEKQEIIMKIIKRETDKDLFDYYSVLSVPVTMILINSNVMWSQYGTMSHAKLLDKLKELKEKYGH